MKWTLDNFITRRRQRKWIKVAFLRSLLRLHIQKIHALVVILYTLPSKSVITFIKIQYEEEKIYTERNDKKDYRTDFLQRTGNSFQVQWTLYRRSGNVISSPSRQSNTVDCSYVSTVPYQPLTAILYALTKTILLISPT